MSAKQLVSSLLLAFLPLIAAAQPEPTVPIENVVFFKSGVSYVEHRGQVQGTETMTLRFSDEQMKDVLKSLVLQDLGGGQIGTIGYPSQDPLSRRLQRFQVNLSQPQGIGALVNQLRGTELTLVTADDSLTGRAVSAESRNGPNGEEEWFLNLYAAGTLRSVALDRVQRVQFEDEQLQDEVQNALGAVAEARDTDENPVRLQFEGSGTRPVRVGYVVKAPVWKTSYRLLLPDESDGKGQIQGWAIVENQTDADWENVDLRLVSGRPVSFVQDLYTPTYVDRPVVSPTVGEPLQPKQHKEGNASPATAEEKRPGRRQAQSVDSPFKDPVGGGSPSPKSARSSPIDPTQGISAAATAAEEGAFFQYRVENVSLLRHRSALLPIVTEPIKIERLSIYDPSLHETHPMQGARLENTTGRHLAAGPVTVFDEGSYGGDAQLTDTPPGDTRFVSYALNQDVQVDRTDQTTEQTVETGKIVQGVLRLSRRRVSSQTYTFENEGETDATVIVEHPRRNSEWSVVKPEPEEQTPSTYRFRTTVDAGDAETLVVRQEKTEEETLQLTDAKRDLLLTYTRMDAIPSDVRNALQKAAELQQALAQTESELNQAEEKRERVRDEQERIRENLAAVEPDTDYHERLLDKLTSTEDEIEAVTDQIDTLEEKKAKQQDRLTRYLQDLDID